MSNQRMNQVLQKPFSPTSSAPSRELLRALHKVHAIPRVSVGGTYNLPCPGLRVRAVPEPLAFPLTRSQAREILKPAAVCKPSTGVGFDLHAMHGCWQVLPSYLTFSNPQWRGSLSSLVRAVSSSLSLPSHLVSAALYGLEIHSHGSKFEAHMPRNTHNVFGTLCIQLPSSFQGGQHTFTHGTQSNQYSCGSHDRSCEFKYYYTAFYNDIGHEISPITNGFRTSLLYDLHWTGEGNIPTANSRIMDPMVTALTNHAKRFHLGAWTLIRSLERSYDKPELEGSGVGALSASDRQELNAIKQAAAQAGLGELDAAICSLHRTEYDEENDDEDEYDVYESEYRTGFVSFDEVYGTTEDWIKTQLQNLSWNSAGLDSGMFFREVSDEGVGGEETFGGLVVVFWPKRKVLAMHALTANDIDEVLDESSRSALIASIDIVLNCKEALGVRDGRAWKHTKRLTEVATKHKLAPQIIRAVNFAAKLPNIPDAKTVLCEVISAIDRQTTQHVIENFFCLKDASSNHDDGEHIRLLDELLSRDLISPEWAVRALGNLVESLNSRKTLRAKRCSDEDVGRWPGCPVEQGHNQPRIKSWSTLLRTFPRIHAICCGDVTAKKTLDEVRKGLAELIKQLDEDDLNIVTEAIETSTDIGESTFIGPHVRDAISSRRSELLIGRFVKETDFLLSRLPHFRESWYAEFNWSKFLRVLNQALSSQSTNEVVQEKYSQILKALPTLASTCEHNSLVTATILVNEELTVRSQVLVEVKQAAIKARLSHVEEWLRARVKALHASTRRKPTNVNVCYPGPFGTGFPRIEEFMASDKMDLSCRLAMNSPARAQQVLQELTTKLPEGIAGMSRTHGKYIHLLLRKPGGEERIQWLKYQGDLKRLEKAEKDHAVALARLKEHEGSGSQQRSRKRKRCSGMPLR